MSLIGVKYAYMSTHIFFVADCRASRDRCLLAQSVRACDSIEHMSLMKQGSVTSNPSLRSIFDRGLPTKYTIFCCGNEACPQISHLPI